MEDFATIVNQEFAPNLLLVRLDATQTQDKNDKGFLCERNSVFQDLIQKQEKNQQSVEAYICENFSCGLPISDIEELKSRIILTPTSSAK